MKHGKWRRSRKILHHFTGMAMVFTTNIHEQNLNKISYSTNSELYTRHLRDFWRKMLLCNVDIIIIILYTQFERITTWFPNGCSALLNSEENANGWNKTKRNQRSSNAPYLSRFSIENRRYLENQCAFFRYIMLK